MLSYGLKKAKLGAGQLLYPSNYGWVPVESGAVGPQIANIWAQILGFRPNCFVRLEPIFDSQ